MKESKPYEVAVCLWRRYLVYRSDEIAQAVSVLQSAVAITLSCVISATVAYEGSRVLPTDDEHLEFGVSESARFDRGVKNAIKYEG